MIINQYYLECLSHASYLVGDEASGTAVVIDPRRDIAEYVRDAEHLGLRITHVIETHLHADFLTGHLELAAATGADIVFGEAAPVEFAAVKLADGDGSIWATSDCRSSPRPVTLPSRSASRRRTAPSDRAVRRLTGDTLFIGDVGRPDLLAGGPHRGRPGPEPVPVAAQKVMALPDATKVYPAHGAGSACGKNLSTENMSTMGEQRRFNYALRPVGGCFVAMVTEGQPRLPATSSTTP